MNTYQFKLLAEFMLNQGIPLHVDILKYLFLDVFKCLSPLKHLFFMVVETLKNFDHDFHKKFECHPKM